MLCFQFSVVFLPMLGLMVRLTSLQGKSGVAGPPGDRGNPGRRVRNVTQFYLFPLMYLKNE